VKKKVPIELLAPAKNAEFGKYAINHGADAVYIGAPNFGARAAVSNPVSDIEHLVKYAHLYRARVYVTLNTILYDNELREVEKIIHQLYQIGVDGIIIQDMGILELSLPPIPLIASTQTHNTTYEKVLFLENVGFKRVILARELSLPEIKEIRKNTSVELESFVHGALCVSYSGQCYMSQAICGRSGNRGVCAQPCRSAYDLVDNNGEKLISDKYLLSLKDLNLSEYIKEMIDAGITSFKIEGRLKDQSYVKNIVSYYRREIDAIISTTNSYRKSSSGNTQVHFVPDPAKSFNRGFTSYFIEGRKEKTGSFLTQKSLGKKVAKITEITTNWFKADGEKLANGDGICFFDINRMLRGTSVNKADGSKIYPKDMEGLYAGLEIYRNHDQQFEKLLEKQSNQRKIGITLMLKEWKKGFRLESTDEDGLFVENQIDAPKIIAEKENNAKDKIINQLSKWGNTAFLATRIEIETNSVYIIPISTLNQMRREISRLLENKRIREYRREEIDFQLTSIPYPEKQLTYRGNVLNKMAEKFYKRHGVELIEPALETMDSYEQKTLMTTRHCIRYQLDACPVHQNPTKRFVEPIYLKDDHHTYKLQFDCNLCVMNVILEK
jgi:putative protease